MFYYSPSVKINKGKDRKGKEVKRVWRATIYYKDDETHIVKQKTKMLPEAKGKKEAQKMAEEWMNELNGNQKTIEKEKREKTITDKIKEYEDGRIALGLIEKSTYQRDLLITKNYITPYLGNKYFISLDRADINKWLTDLYKSGKSPTTIRNAFTQLKKVYSYYFSIDEIASNPFNYVKVPKQGEHRITHLTKEQGDAFISAVYTEYKPEEPMFVGCLLAYYGGLRRGEICGLRWRNIDFDKATITVDSSIGIGQGGNYTKPPKSKSSNRTFPIIPQLYEALKARFDYIKPEGSWFVIGEREKFMSLQRFTNNFQKLADAYDLKDYYNKRITPHGLRHNLATVGINSGMDIASLSLVLGHASRAITLDIYGDANKDALKTATDKLSLKFDEDSDIPPSEEVADKLNAIEDKLLDKKDEKKDDKKEEK